LGFAPVGAVADIFDDVLNRGNGYGNVNVIAVILNVHVDFSVVDGDFHVLVFAVDLHEIRIG